MSRGRDPDPAGISPEAPPDASPEVLADAPPEAMVDGADPLQQRARALREQYAEQGFTVLIEAPSFVVLGNEEPQTVQRRAEGTIRWAVQRLREQFFEQAPNDIIDIWLFADDRSYRQGARTLFGDEPDTPYGYFSSTHRALVMNISTGGGTLVHELVHPFVEADFPACPAWFDEGLASLYEQCADRSGEIRGLTNWRLAGLQEAIAAQAVPSFRTLTATSRDQFYGEDPGTNYAQARYLCYWLQEHGKLQSFYRAFRDGHAQDPTGYRYLREAVADANMERFESDWRAFVMELRYG